MEHLLENNEWNSYYFYLIILASMCAAGNSCSFYFQMRATIHILSANKGVSILHGLKVLILNLDCLTFGLFFYCTTSSAWLYLSSREAAW